MADAPSPRNRNRGYAPTYMHAHSILILEPEAFWGIEMTVHAPRVYFSLIRKNSFLGAFDPQKVCAIMFVQTLKYLAHISPIRFRSTPLLTPNFVQFPHLSRRLV